MPSPNRPRRRISNHGRSSLPAGFVRDRLADDVNWQHYTNDERWICPYCLKDLRAPRTGKSALVSHIESHLSNRCANFKGGEGQIQSDQAIYERKLGLYIEEQARNNSAWQVFDHEGYWYSPSSLSRVPSVRIVNGRFDSFTVQQMVTHLKSCPQFTQGTIHDAAAVQAARDNGIRISSLATNLQRVVTQPVWRFYSPQGWLCPYCTHSIPHIHQGLNPGDALNSMASHLMQECAVYRQDQRAIKNEGQLQQVLQQYQQASAPAPVAAPVQAPIAHPSGEIPAAAAIREPTQQLPTPQTLERTNSGHIPIAQPAAGRTPSGYLPIATPINGTPANPPSGQIPVAQPATSQTPVSNEYPSTAFTSTPVTQHNLSSLHHDTSPTQNKSGGYSKISDDLDGIIDGFDKEEPDGLPSSGADAQWITSSTSKKTKTLSDTSENISAPSDALEAAEEPTPEADAEDAFSWMDAHEEVNEDTTPSHNENTDLIRAQGLQKGLMNDCPQIPGYSFGTRYEACSTVSGDFYEFIEKEDGRIIFAQGDVSGHGVEAGLIMSMARKCLTIFARQGGEPIDVVANLNEALVDDLKGEKFITMCYGELDPAERTIRWIRSGHNPVLRYNIYSKEFSEIKPGGMVVGMKGGKLFRQLLQEEVTPLQSGDVFLIYTDGFNETMSRQGEEYGFERMQHVITDKADQGIEILLDHLMNSVRQFRGTTKADDDLTLLALAVD